MQTQMSIRVTWLKARGSLDEQSLTLFGHHSSHPMYEAYVKLIIYVSLIKYFIRLYVWLYTIYKILYHCLYLSVIYICGVPGVHVNQLSVGIAWYQFCRTKLSIYTAFLMFLPLSECLLISM